MTPQQHLNDALQQGLSTAEAVRLVMGGHGLSLSATKALLPKKPELSFASLEEVTKFLKEKLGYCGCSYYEEAQLALRDCLRWAGQIERPELPRADGDLEA